MKDLLNRLKQHYKLTIAAAAALCVLLVLVSAVVYKATRPKPPKTILVNGNYVIVDDTLSLNNLTQEQFTQDEGGRWQCPDRNAATGIDVSVFQGDIDWSAVKADGIGFAFIRAGSRGYGNGEIKPDANLPQNLTGAQQAGLSTGVYFFSQAITEEEALEEAAFVLEALNGAELEMPIVFDWEPMDRLFTDGDAVNVRTVGQEENVTACALAFCDAVEAAGYDSMVYLNNDTGYFVYDIHQLQGKKLWYAAYNAQWADFYYQVDAWQYSQSGTVSGIEGPVDLSLWLSAPAETDGNAADAS